MLRRPHRGQLHPTDGPLGQVVQVPVGLDVRFLRGLPAGVADARAEVVHSGRSLTVVDVAIDGADGRRAAHATHTTGYGDLHRTYHEVERWCAENGESPVGVQWEVYADPDADDHVDVEIYFLLS